MPVLPHHWIHRRIRRAELEQCRELAYAGVDRGMVPQSAGARCPATIEPRRTFTDDEIHALTAYLLTLRQSGNAQGPALLARIVAKIFHRGEPAMSTRVFCCSLSLRQIVVGLQNQAALEPFRSAGSRLRFRSGLERPAARDPLELPASAGEAHLLRAMRLVPCRLHSRGAFQSLEPEADAGADERRNGAERRERRLLARTSSLWVAAPYRSRL